MQIDFNKIENSILKGMPDAKTDDPALNKLIQSINNAASKAAILALKEYHSQISSHKSGLND